MVIKPDENAAALAVFSSSTATWRDYGGRSKNLEARLRLHSPFLYIHRERWTARTGHTAGGCAAREIIGPRSHALSQGYVNQISLLSVTCVCIRPYQMLIVPEFLFSATSTTPPHHTKKTCINILQYIAQWRGIGHLCVTLGSPHTNMV